MSDNLTLQAGETLDRDAGQDLVAEARKLKPAKDATVVLDLSRTTEINSLGAAAMIQIADVLRERGATLSLEGHKEHVTEFVEMIGPGLGTKTIKAERDMGFVERLGEGAIAFLDESKEFAELCIDSIYWALIAPFEGRGIRWSNLMDEMYEMGVRAVGIVSLMNFLLGLIMAMLLAKQAESYGIQLFVADVIMIGFARELAAIMTAVVVSARTGAAIAAEISTMKVQEEIDALRGMGVNVTQYLVVPKLIAMIICLPCLAALGILAGLAGGAVWGIFVLDFQPDMWYRQTLNAAFMSDLTQGMLKTLVFAVAIVLIGCHNGFRVRGGSRGVGLMTTRAVVMDIFMLICVDIVFALAFYYVIE